MTDTELQAWWPDCGTLVTELRKMNQAAVADLLLDALRGGSTSGEILDNIGVVLREHRTVRGQLGSAGIHAWDAVRADVHRASPGSRLGHWLSRITGR